MKRTFLALCIIPVIFLSTCKRSVQPDANVQSHKTYTIEQFTKIVSISGSSFSFDDKNILYSSNATGIYNAYTIPVVGGIPTQLTTSTTDAIYAISFFPSDNRILYKSDKGGNELSHIFLREEDGTVKDLTPSVKAKSEFFEWSHDQRSFFYRSSERDPQFLDVYEMDIAGFAPKLIYENKEGYDLRCISPDERYFVLVKSVTSTNTHMYLYDRDTKGMKHLTPHEGEVSYNPQTFSVDSKSLFYLTDENSEFTHLKRYDIASSASELVEQYPWDIVFSRFSDNGKFRVTFINENGIAKAKIYDTASNQPVSLDTDPGTSFTFVKFSRSENLMAFHQQTSRMPRNLFVYDFGKKKATQLTKTLNPEISPADLVEAKLVRYKSFDGLEIPAVLYRPHQVKSGDMAPGLVWVHGGPGGQALPSYDPRIQFMVNHGYVVIDVNHRGSSGYGKTFFNMDNRKHGEVDLDDCVYAKKYLISTKYVDESKIGIVGGSYGGYMVLAALAFRPLEFGAGVDAFGVSNWIRTLESIPPWWESFRDSLYAEMGNPKTDSEYLRQISPLFHAANIVRPLMVLQGANDPRVLKSESDDIVAAVKKNGVPVEYLVFDDEGHGFVKEANEIRAYNAMLDFLDKHLKREAR